MSGRTTAAAVAVALWSVLVGCGDPALLDLAVVLPQGDDPLADADQLTLKLSEPDQDQVLTVDDPAHFELELKADVESKVASIALDARAKGKLIARGETPPLILRPRDDSFKLLVAASRSVSRLRARLSVPRRSPAATVMPSRGVLIAGGLDGRSRASDRAELYDFFDHSQSELPRMPDPRSGAVAASCGGHCAIVALGKDGGGELATDLLRFFGTSWARVDDGLAAAERRSDGVAVLLADGGYLVAGGIAKDGKPKRSLLRINGGSAARAPSIRVASGKALAARSTPAAAVAGGFVLLAGGQGSGKPVAELYEVATGKSSAVELPGPQLASGAAAAAIDDHRFALIGGRDGQGTLLRDGWIIDARNRSARRVSKALAHPRADHRIEVIGDRVIVLGGVGTDGAIATGELLSTDKLASVSTFAQIKRRDFVVARLSRSSLLIAAGRNGDGDLIDRLEVYQHDDNGD